MSKTALQEKALEMATRIHEEHRGSYWEQQFLVQELIAELARLDREYQEATHGEV